MSEAAAISSIPDSGASLFAGGGQLFARILADASVYAEYGMGESTLWVLANTQATVHAVDTSSHWIRDVQSKAADRSRLHATWIDLGPLGDWGRPVTFRERHRFPHYIQAVWSGAKPDVVLIDGRFRVCCFLHSLLSADPGTRIIFDDYADRPYYHVVEEFIAPVQRHGRQALFVVPEEFDRKAVNEARQRFLYVMD